MRKVARVMDDDRIRLIFELSEQGRTYRQITSEMKTSDVSVSKYLKKGLDGSLEYARKLREASKSPSKLSKEEITRDSKASLWLNSMAKGSLHNYMTGLAYYCAMVERKPNELIKEAIESIKEGKLLSERDYFMWFKQFEDMLKEERFADCTQSNYQTAVRSFYGFYDIEMPKKKGGRRRRRAKPLRGNSKVEITKKDIQYLLDVSKYLRDKALVLAVSSSGLGRAEIRLLNVSDFVNGYQEETGICMLNDVWRVKTENDFISFFSNECSAMIWQYLKMERGIKKEEIKRHLKEPLFTATKNTWKGAKGLLSRLAPVSIDQIFRNLAIRIDADNAPHETEDGNMVFNTFHPHNIRKFFNTQMKLAGCPEIAVEFMMGHTIDSTRSSYWITKPDDLMTRYLQFMPAITLQSTKTRVLTSHEYKELKEENKELKIQLEEMKRIETERTSIDDTLDQLLSDPKVQAALREKFEEIKNH